MTLTIEILTAPGAPISAVVFLLGLAWLSAASAAPKVAMIEVKGMVCSA